MAWGGDCCYLGYGANHAGGPRDEAGEGGSDVCESDVDRVRKGSVGGVEEVGVAGMGSGGATLIRLAYGNETRFSLVNTGLYDANCSGLGLIESA